ncbi:polymer-forming cytoskeletal protein [Thiomicrorhabdus sp. Kp2]|uniref:bactofilin family protein n=1 Tax=Thiomicrorhabdus sp. Kp2 TaxID=1123518 RepID=UPI0006851005|nr:polymer-forming cytoskeletal protein [Thiomicrorhabdus sp. Kp2]
MGIFKSKRRPNRQEGGKTIIADGCFISGEISELKGSLHIDGRVEGIIDSDFDVSIGVTGHVSGLLKARSIVLSGVLDGKVACEKIDILQSGKLIGELISGELTVETGGKFIGQSHEMTEGGMVVSLPETFAQLTHRANKSQEALTDHQESKVLKASEPNKSDD